MSPDVLPLVLTAGEPAGIGPDLCLQLAAGPRPDGARPWLVAGCPATLRARAERLGLPVTLRETTPADMARTSVDPRTGVIHCWPFPVATPVTPGRLDPRNARAVIVMLREAAMAVARGEAAGLVTAPVQKSVINDAGMPFTGHTEFLAGLFPDSRGRPCPVVMLLVAGTLRVALATTHLPLRAVPAAITTAALVDTLRLLDHDLRHRFRLAEPRIAVLGLNPHAGEDGHLGTEDREVIAPAVTQARSLGIDARGPVPADTAFTPRALAATDAVLAMYHDQGLPVLKHAGFGAGVNVTVGLPILRTSVDHGTALELAGTGRADAGSLQAAIDLAEELLPVVPPTGPGVGA